MKQHNHVIIGSGIIDNDEFTLKLTIDCHPATLTALANPRKRFAEDRKPDVILYDEKNRPAGAGWLSTSRKGKSFYKVSIDHPTGSRLLASVFWDADGIVTVSTARESLLLFEIAVTSPVHDILSDEPF